MTTTEMHRTKKANDEMVARFEEEGRKWGAKLDEINAKIAKTSADVKEGVREDYLKSIENLKSKYEAAQKKLAEFRTSGDDKWEHFKDDMETVWKDIEATFKGLTH